MYDDVTKHLDPEHTEPTLPLKPEPMCRLRARLPDALRSVFVAGHTGSSRPGTRRTQVFDTMDGHRLIVSRDYEARSKQTYLHISVSAVNPSQAVKAKKLEVSPTSDMWICHCLLRVRDLFEAHWPLRCVYVQVSPAGVVHFLCEDVPRCVQEGEL